MPAFTARDFLKEETNAPVLKYFAIFFVAMIVVPLATFFGTSRVLQSFALSTRTAGLASAVVAVLTCHIIMATYAIAAYREVKVDFAQATEDDKEKKDT